MFDTKQSRMRGAFFLLAAVLHGAGIYFLSFSEKPEAEPLLKSAVKTLQLVHIQEEAPPEPQVQPLAAVQPLPRVQLPPASQPAPEAAPVPAEFIETQSQSPPETPAASPVAAEPVALEPVQPASSGAASNPGKRNEDGAVYIKKNYNYIQRRIKEKLVYPAEAKRAGFQGTVEAVFTVHTDGSVSGVFVRAGSGQALLDQAAVDAIYNAAPFRPPPPAAIKIAVPVSFKLR
jgi:protein TonB